MPLQENLVVNKKDNRVFMSRNYRSDSCSWKFYVLKTIICALEALLLGQIGHFTVVFLMTGGPFLESPGNLTGPVSYFEIKFSRKVCCVLTSNEAHFVSLANNFTLPFSKLLELPSLMENKKA